jgi:hypothetical protein
MKIKKIKTLKKSKTTQINLTNIQPGITLEKGKGKNRKLKAQ